MTFRAKQPSPHRRGKHRGASLIGLALLIAAAVAGCCSRPNYPRPEPLASGWQAWVDYDDCVSNLEKWIVALIGHYHSGVYDQEPRGQPTSNKPAPGYTPPPDGD